MPLDDLIKQVRKYRDGARKILEKTTYKDWPIESSACSGAATGVARFTALGKSEVIDGLKTVDARIVFYDELLTNAQQAYADYLDEHVKLDKLWGVFDAIDDFAPQVARARQPRRTVG